MGMTYEWSKYFSPFQKAYNFLRISPFHAETYMDLSEYANFANFENGHILLLKRKYGDKINNFQSLAQPVHFRRHHRTSSSTLVDYWSTYTRCQLVSALSWPSHSEESEVLPSNRGLLVVARCMRVRTNFNGYTRTDMNEEQPGSYVNTWRITRPKHTHLAIITYLVASDYTDPRRSG